MLRLPTVEQARALVSRFEAGQFNARRDGHALMEALYDPGLVISEFDWMRCEEGRINSESLAWIEDLDFPGQCKLYVAPG